MGKIIFVAYSFEKGGAARSANRMADLLARTYEVDKIAIRFSESSLSLTRRLSGLIKTIADRAILSLVPRTYRGEKLNIDMFSGLRAQDIASNSDSIVFLHWFQNGTISLHEIKKTPGRLWFYCHDEWLLSGLEHYQTPYRNFFKDCIKRRFKARFTKLVSDDRVERVFVPSYYLRKMFEDEYGIVAEILRPPLSNSVYFFNGAEKARGKVVRILFGSASRCMEYIKGFDIIRDSIIRLKQDKIRIEVSCFGAAPDTEFPVDLNYLGFISDENALARLYREHDIVLCPSRYEAFGQVAAEALMCGCYIVGTRDTGLNDIVIDDSCGALIECGSATGLAEAIKEAIENEEHLSLNAKISRSMMGAKKFGGGELNLDAF